MYQVPRCLQVADRLVAGGQAVVLILPFDEEDIEREDGIGCWVIASRRKLAEQGDLSVEALVRGCVQLAAEKEHLRKVSEEDEWPEALAEGEEDEEAP
jgi:hypothetical protein